MKRNIFKTNSKESALKILFYLLAFITIYFIVYPISPLSDDWYYLTAPNPDFTLADLLPSNQFWRPFDALFGGLMGLVPEMFPTLNRLIVVLGHILNGALLGGVAKQIGISPKWQMFSVCFFLFSSAVWAVTVSPDALNQTFSVLFGLLAIWLHFKYGGYYYAIFCFLALLWKESGVSWFFVVPLFDAFVRPETEGLNLKDKEKIKRFAKRIAVSLISVVAYFVVRFALLGEVALGSGDGGTYKLSLLSFSTVKNAILLLVSGATGIDSIALFSKNRTVILVVITFLLSAAFLLTWLFSTVSLIKQKKKTVSLICIFLCVLGLAFPLMILGSAGEMHAYPVLCGMSILLAYGFSHSHVAFKKVLISVICIFIAFGITSVHKVKSIYDYSDRTEKLTQSIMESYDRPQGSALFVLIDDWEGYSVFEQSAAMGTYRGYSVRPYFDWVEVDHQQNNVKSKQEADEYITQHADEYDKVFIVEKEKAVRIK